jgi:hypothetical protein
MLGFVIIIPPKLISGEVTIGCNAGEYAGDAGFSV